MALHNIPKALLNNEMSSYLNIGVLPLSLDDVKTSVNRYISLSEK